MAGATAAAENPQTAEVSAVRENFPGRCRIIKDVGMFTNVVTIQPQNMDATLKFQLTELYPSVVPDISIRSDSLTAQDSEDLQRHLADRGRQLLGQTMLQTLVAEAERWLKGHGVKPGKTVKANAEVIIADGKKKQKQRPRGKKKKRSGEEDEDGDEKKPSMKTADDVIKRILWDDKLDKDDFLVGYLDRFKGVVEKYFSAFSWEDIAAVDYDVLAVPKHRIQYFKYRQQKIWDKPSRLDNVFGSRGSGVTIYDVIEKYQEGGAASGGGGDNDGNHDGNVGDGDDAHSHDDGDSYEDSDEDDSDDGITVTIGTSVNTYAPGIKTTAAEADIDWDVDAEDDSGYNPYWRDKLRPNYFLAVRITDPEIRQGAKKVQDFLLGHEPVYEPCCIPQQSLHITLCTLGLDTPEQVAHAGDVLKKIQPEIEASLPKGPITLEGVSNFYKRVVYAQVPGQKEFLDFAEYVRLLVKEAGLEIRDNHDFVPHMTLMKVNRPVARQVGTKNVAEYLYRDFAAMRFGQQSIDAVFLCSMGDERREDGFYVCPAEIHFGGQ